MSVSSRGLSDLAGLPGFGFVVAFGLVAVAAGLGFVLSMSAYITPKLLGGGRVFVLATEIFEQATTNTNWPVAAVLAIYTLMLLLALLVVSNLVARRLQR